MGSESCLSRVATIRAANVSNGRELRLFDSVVCGVDNSAAGCAAARAAALVTDPRGTLTLISANDTSLAVHAGWGMNHIVEELAADAVAALERGAEVARPVHDVEGRLIDGDPLRVLLAEVERREATAVVIGSHGHSRTAGIALGSVTSALLHEAPCAVLVARGELGLRRWPRRIVAAIDGSADSARACLAARELATRLGSPFGVVVATRDRDVDLAAARAFAPELEEHGSRPLDLLTVVAGPSDLLVVGSRGRRGLRALGSVSERVAHDSASSVLVVRHRA